MPPRRQQAKSHPKLSARARNELETKANTEFRSVVRRRAHRIKLWLVAAIRQQCEHAGVELIGPRLQYRADDPNRGRYYVTSVPLPGSTRKMFRYVSDPLSPRRLMELEDWRVAREYQDEGLRPIRLGLSNVPLGTTSFLRSLGLEKYSTRSRRRPGIPHVPETIRRTGARTSAPTRATPSRGRASQARTLPSRRSASIEVIGHRRARSPSLEVIDAPPRTPVVDLTLTPRSLRVVYYASLSAQPQRLDLEQAFRGAVYDLKSYAPQWNGVEMKLSDTVKMLVSTPGNSKTWYRSQLGALVLSSSTRRIVLAASNMSSSDLDDISDLYPTWAYTGHIPIEIN
ncbi:unnamed protein product [Peniophora sp. CBMAI 1063]|nr:unnamed protein product [Peniophora sp. CBMAI 1063]